MGGRFIQKRVSFENEKGTGKLQVSKLITLLEKHQYLDKVSDAFDVDSIKNEYINIDNIDIVFNRIKYFNDNFYRFLIYAHNKDIVINRSNKSVEGISEEKPLVFNFKEYVNSDGEAEEELHCYPIYNAKNTYLDTFDMTKYANSLYKNGLDSLVEYNINYFRELASQNSRYDNNKSYRLVENKGKTFLRGITSIDRYFEYGVDFTFVVSMLVLHNNMKRNQGNNYEISTASISESKLDLIITEKQLKDAGEFGKVGSAMAISTNDLGEGSLSFTKIINVKGRKSQYGIYLFPESEEAKKNKYAIPHSTGADKTISKLDFVYTLLNDTDDYIDELKAVKAIKTPEELRIRIFNKIIHPRSAFKDVTKLQDIFKLKIDNEISSFAKLLEMCNKAEELEIEYDLKDKLRYIISDIILNLK